MAQEMGKLDVHSKTSAEPPLCSVNSKGESILCVTKDWEFFSPKLCHRSMVGIGCWTFIRLPCYTQSLVQKQYCSWSRWDWNGGWKDGRWRWEGEICLNTPVSRTNPRSYTQGSQCPSNDTAEKTEKKKSWEPQEKNISSIGEQQLKWLQIIHQIPRGSKGSGRTLKCGKKTVNVLYPAKNQPSGIEGVTETFSDEQKTDEVK